MAGDAAPAPQTCKICDAEGIGHFCSQCGHEFARSRLSWIERLPLIGDSIRFVSTIGRMFGSPVAEPLRLATAPSFRGHKALLVSALAVWGAFAYFISLATGASGNSGPATPTDALFFIDLAVSGLIAWLLFRVLAPEPVSFDKHAKLWMVLAAFYLVAHVLVIVLAAVLALIAQESFPSSAAMQLAWIPALSVWIIRAVRATMIAHFAVAFGRLWKMPFWQSVLLLVMAWALAIYPSRWLQYGLGYGYGVVAGGMQEIRSGGPAAGGQL